MIRNWNLAFVILVLSAGNAGSVWARGFGGYGGGERSSGERERGSGGQRGGYGGGERGGGERGGYGGGQRGGYGGSSSRYGGEQNRGGYGGSSSRYGTANNERSRTGNEGGREESQRYAGDNERNPAANERYGAAGGNPYRAEGASRYGTPAAGEYSRGAAYRGGAEANHPQAYRYGGLPSDAGMHTVASANPYSSGFNAENLNRNAVMPGLDGNAAQNYRGDANAFAAGAGTGYRYSPPSARYTNATAVRTNYNGAGMYSPEWYGARPGAWAAAGTAAYSAWSPATWGALNGWYGGGSSPPTSYDYGSNVVYNNNSVYVDGQNAGTAEQYYNQAMNTASNINPTPDGQQPQWMSLGVFAATPPGQNNPLGTLQLAVDKVGNLRGNYTDTGSGQVQPVSGTVDRKTQRAAFTIGDKLDPVVEAGLYNLTKDEATALVHHGKDRTDQWLLVRLTQNSSGQQ